jgi:HEAT repeat protein
MNELVELMMDASHQARILAARAVAYTGWDKGALLLRLKILAGDREPEVTAECIVALAGLERVRALEFIKRFLGAADETISGAAALALGEMRHGSALKVLLEQWESDRSAEGRSELVLPIALSRLPESVEFLAEVIRSADERVALAAVEALRIYRHDEAACTTIREAVEGRGSETLRRGFAAQFE